MPRKSSDEAEGCSLLLPLLGVAAVLLLGVGVVWCFFFRSGDADVRGLVTLDDKLVPFAVVVFISDGAAKEATISTQADKNGNYRLVGNTGAGIPAGSYKVVVTQQTLKDGTIPEGKDLEQARRKGLLSNALPKVYEDRATTPLQFDVRSGGNTINLELKKPLKVD